MKRTFSARTITLRKQPRDPLPKRQQKQHSGRREEDLECYVPTILVLSTKIYVRTHNLSRDRACSFVRSFLHISQNLHMNIHVVHILASAVFMPVLTTYVCSTCSEPTAEEAYFSCMRGVGMCVHAIDQDATISSFPDCLGLS